MDEQAEEISPEQALELLKKIKTKEKSNDPSTALASTNFYAHLIVNKRRRQSYVFLFFLFWMLAGVIIYREMIMEYHWLLIAGPMLIIGGLISLLPPIEIWNYTPWQVRAQQYERNVVD